MRKVLAATTALVAGVAMFFASAEPAEAAPCALISVEIVIMDVLPPIPICI